MADKTRNSGEQRRDVTALAAQRQAAQARSRTIAIVSAVVVVIVIVVLAVVLVGKGKKKDAATGVTTNSPGSVTCTYTPNGQPAAKDVGRPPTSVMPQSHAVTMTTNQGDIAMTLDGAKAPCTVNSWVYLADKGYFDNTNCHRLTTSGIFVLQCGDPTGSGRGGPGYAFGDENLAGATYPAGTVAMANAGPGTNGSQFFLVYKDTQLPPSYTPFGTVTKGLDILNAIAAKGSDNSNGPGDGKPKTPVVIKKITIGAS